MPRDFDDIIHTPDDPVVTVSITLSRVARGIAARILAPILIYIALIIAVNGAQHGGPGSEQSEVPFRIIWDGIALFVHDLSLLTEERSGARTRFERHNRCRRNLKRAGLRLPPRIDDGAFLLADHTVIPLPCLRVDGFPHGAKQAQR